MATQKGLEPSTSGVTGRHSNQLSHQATCGGHNRARTCDPLLVRQMLSQLSYAPTYMVEENGFEPLKTYVNRFTVCPLWPLGNSSMFMVLAVGLEPTTY